ncbi:Glycosyl transferase family 2 [Glycomyces sambucus]|uniref:Glycosyl transferase family 2 n=1 Tax=Glycomyces sambucus TaxID=380244 RepID=A0A1G9J8D8_9ACTN|nr:glycosyltransferase [Glycomyces sambucus]SDL33810.1 Glycosyl transferase family 2 [Glycomyces sambucus]
MTGFINRLVERSLGTAGVVSVADVHEWGQFHNSRLAPHVLARLAYPDDPDALLNPVDHLARLDRAALNLEAVCALGATIGLKARTAEDRARALALFDLAERRLGARMPIEYRELHVMTAYLSGQRARVRALIRTYPDLPANLTGALHCHAAHPRSGGSTRAYMKRLKAFANWPELELDGSEPSIDRLRTAPVRAVEGGPLISVVMTCFEPDARLLSAVRSVVAQSWQRWELLLVDDGSGPDFAEVLREAAGLDPRVKLLIQPENAGTYQARNRAMAVAAGEFITGLDSDDWAHPRRLERQVAPFLQQHRVVMVESLSIAVREDLSLVIDPQTAVVAARSTPIMIRAKEVLERVGFYDEVRRTADSEYRFRIKAVFGRKGVARVKGGPCTLVRHADGTLSAGEVSRHWMSASRFAYHSGFTRWHRRLAAGEASPHLASRARPRPFPISADITRGRTQNLAIDYGRIYAADWSALDEPRRRMLGDATRRAARGAAIGLVHCPDWVRLDGDRSLIHETVLTAAAEHGFDFIDLDARHTAPVAVPTAAYAELLRFEHPGLEEDRVRVQSPGPVPDAPSFPEIERHSVSRRRQVRAVVGRLRQAARRPVNVAAGAAGLVAIGSAAGVSVPAAIATAGALLAGAAYLKLRRALERTRIEAAKTKQAKVSGAVSERALRKAAQLEARLHHGWSGSAAVELAELAASSEEQYEARARALAVLAEHRSIRSERVPRELDCDIVIVSTLNLRGGTSSANEAEILAYRAAGLKVGLVHHPVKDRALDRAIDPRIQRLVDGEHVVLVHHADTVRCDLAIVRFPVALAELMEDRPQVDAARTVLLVNQTPFEEYGIAGGYGTAWSVEAVHRNVTDWLGPHTWYAIGPAVRDTLRTHHAAEIADIDVAQDFWYETIDVADWTPARPRVRADGAPFRLGRHSRDHVTKFPNMAARLRAAYPDSDEVEVHLLGGQASITRLLGAVPPRWTSHPFGSMGAAEFLAGVDAYSYFVDEQYIEAFGRAPLEAMATGVPCILAPSFAELFGDGALYCEPAGVAALVRRLAADPDFHAERAAAGLRVIAERFSPEALVARVRGLGVGARPAIPAPSVPVSVPAQSVGGA